MMPALPHAPLPRMQNESLLGELVNQAEPVPVCYYFPPETVPQLVLQSEETQGSWLWGGGGGGGRGT